MKSSFRMWFLSRRGFLHRSAGAAGLSMAATLAKSARPASGETGSEANPYAYDVGRLVKTDPKLLRYEEVTRWRSPHGEARRIATGADGQVYVVAGKYVSVLDNGGTPRLEIALSTDARCVTVTPDNDILIGLRTHLERFDQKGQRRAEWASPGPRTWLTSVAATAQGVFAADAGGRVIHHYDADGKILARLGEKNKQRNVPGFIVPSPFFDLKMHRDGLLRVANPGRHRIEAYTIAGEFEFAWGKPSSSIVGFCGCCNPVSFTLLPDDRFITCEKGLPRVKVYRPDGTFECVVAGPESFTENLKNTSADGLSDISHGGLDAAVDGKGRVYILDLVTGAILVMAPKAGASVQSQMKSDPFESGSKSKRSEGKPINTA